MQTISCPNCGGEVVFRSAASVMAVCEYCRSTLLKDAESVKNIGKMSDLLEDYSPLQITSSGIYKGRNFTLVGRIQLRYAAGTWNEWYAMFDDGSAGWLSDASGQYIFTEAAALPSGSIYAFATITPGLALPYQGLTYFAADVRTAECVSGQGELPFHVGDGWQVPAADFRSGHRFLTLDYSNGPRPQLYVGQAVSLQQLRCQLLRTQDTISSTAGRFLGQAVALDCPACGSPIKYMAGMAIHIVCPACHAEVDCSADKAQVLQKAHELEQISTSIALGDTANINGSKYETIGFMQCQTVADGEAWTWVEYLLFNTDKGFLWLVESTEGWDCVTVLNEWPDQTRAASVVLGDATYVKAEDYEATVLYAAGAFNWRISIGDRTRVTEFRKGKRTLTAEANANEIVWSSGRSVSAGQMNIWLGKKADVQAAVVEKSSRRLATGVPWGFTLFLLFLNVPMMFESGMAGFFIIVVALIVLWLPVWIVQYFSKDRNE